jgi:hypothetical protein
MVYLVACGAFLLLSMPPEVGRIELRDTSVLLAFLVMQAAAVTYLSSAVASSEVAIEGEKALPDLTLSTFSPSVIAVGKAESSAAYAVYLLAVTLPLLVVASALRGTSIGPVLWAGILTFAVATAAGLWGAWLAGRFASDFTRSFVHWVGLAALFGGTTALPPPWSRLSPIRAIDEIIRMGSGRGLAVPIGSYVLAAVLGALLIRSHVRGMRIHETGV